MRDGSLTEQRLAEHRQGLAIERTDNPRWKEQGYIFTVWTSPACMQYRTGHQDSAVLLAIAAHHQEARNHTAIEKVERRRKGVAG
jgi:hypothetical protein